MSDPKPTTHKDLGWKNGWVKAPELYLACKAEEHKLKVGPIGICAYQYHCPDCRITFSVDSN